MGQSLVVPRHLSQHNRQQVCQQPVEAVGSLYGSRHIRHTTAGARQDPFSLLSQFPTEAKLARDSAHRIRHFDFQC